MKASTTTIKFAALLIVNSATALLAIILPAQSIPQWVTIGGSDGSDLQYDYNSLKSLSGGTKSIDIYQPSINSGETIYISCVNWKSAIAGSSSWSIMPPSSKVEALAYKVCGKRARNNQGSNSNLEDPTNAKISHVKAYFYQFTPASCSVSLTKYGASSCSTGMISVAADDKDSVNIHLISPLGQWQILLADGSSFLPKVNAILIRSIKNVAAKIPAPDFYYNSTNGDILSGECTQVILAPQLSVRCIARLRDTRVLDVSFKTDSLKPADNVKQAYQ
jgi:hypothetical protein